jgi:CheY-like chemotaxis protein
MGERVPVLLVDDEEVIRAALRSWLEEDGVPVVEAEDGIEALYILDQTRTPLIIVTDHAMPRLDGRGLVDFVTKNADLARRTVLIYMTAGGRILSPVFAGDLQTLGVQVLRKPFSLEELTRAVAEAEAQLQARLAADVPAEPHEQPVKNC